MKNQPNQTSELQINLTEFEEFAKKFTEQHSDKRDEIYCSYRTLAEVFIDGFKEFILSEQLNKQKRKEEYFKLKEQLESMKAEFEPESKKDDEVTYRDCEGEYVAVEEGASKNCDGCAFANKSCDAVINFHSCGEHRIIWIKK